MKQEVENSKQEVGFPLEKKFEAEIKSAFSSGEKRKSKIVQEKSAIEYYRSLSKNRKYTLKIMNTNQLIQENAIATSTYIIAYDMVSSGIKWENLYYLNKTHPTLVIETAKLPGLIQALSAITSRDVQKLTDADLKDVIKIIDQFHSNSQFYFNIYQNFLCIRGKEKDMLSRFFAFWLAIDGACIDLDTANKILYQTDKSLPARLLGKAYGKLLNDDALDNPALNDEIAKFIMQTPEYKQASAASDFLSITRSPDPLLNLLMVLENAKFLTRKSMDIIDGSTKKKFIPIQEAVEKLLTRKKLMRDDVTSVELEDFKKTISADGYAKDKDIKEFLDVLIATNKDYMVDAVKFSIEHAGIILDVLKAPVSRHIGTFHKIFYRKEDHVLHLGPHGYFIAEYDVKQKGAADSESSFTTRTIMKLEKTGYKQELDNQENDDYSIKLMPIESKLYQTLKTKYQNIITKDIFESDGKYYVIAEGDFKEKKGSERRVPIVALIKQATDKKEIALQEVVISDEINSVLQKYDKSTKKNDCVYPSQYFNGNIEPNIIVNRVSHVLNFNIMGILIIEEFVEVFQEKLEEKFEKQKSSLLRKIKELFGKKISDESAYQIAEFLKLALRAALSEPMTQAISLLRTKPNEPHLVTVAEQEKFLNMTPDILQTMNGLKYISAVIFKEVFLGKPEVQDWEAKSIMLFVDGPTNTEKQGKEKQSKIRKNNAKTLAKYRYELHNIAKPEESEGFLREDHMRIIIADLLISDSSLDDIFHKIKQFKKDKTVEKLNINSIFLQNLPKEFAKLEISGQLINLIQLAVLKENKSAIAHMRELKISDEDITHHGKKVINNVRKDSEFCKWAKKEYKLERTASSSHLNGFHRNNSDVDQREANDIRKDNNSHDTYAPVCRVEV